MDKKTITVGVANQEKERIIKMEDVKKWAPTKVSYIGTSTYFKIMGEKPEDDGTFYSMDTDEFRETFHQINKEWVYLEQ